MIESFEDMDLSPVEREVCFTMRYDGYCNFWRPFMPEELERPFHNNSVSMLYIMRELKITLWNYSYD